MTGRASGGGGSGQGAISNEDGDEVVHVPTDGPPALGVRDEEQLDLLRLIYKELRKIRFLAEHGQGVELGNTDFDDEDR